MVVRRSKDAAPLLALLFATVVFAGPPLLPPRDYTKTVVAVTGDEAVVLKIATEAMQALIAKRASKLSLSRYYATIRTRDSQWLVEWSLNDGDARGGGIDIVIDQASLRVVSIRDVE